MTTVMRPRHAAMWQRARHAVTIAARGGEDPAQSGGAAPALLISVTGSLAATVPSSQIVSVRDFGTTGDGTTYGRIAGDGTTGGETNGSNTAGVGRTGGRMTKSGRWR